MAGLLRIFILKHSFLLLFLYFIVIVVACLWPFNFFQMNRTTWNTQGGLRFTPESIVYTETPPVKLARLQQFSVFIKLAPSFNPPSIPGGQIISYSADSKHYNLIIDQLNNNFVFKIQNHGSQTESHEIIVQNVFKDKIKDWLGIVYDGSSIQFYAEGEKRKGVNASGLGHLIWDESYPLILGNSGDLKYPWSRFCNFP